MVELITLTSLLIVNVVPLVELQAVMVMEDGQPKVNLRQCIVWDMYETDKGQELHVREWFKRESTEVTKVDGKWLVIATRADAMYIIQPLAIVETTSFTDAEVADQRAFNPLFRKPLERRKRP